MDANPVRTFIDLVNYDKQLRDAQRVIDLNNQEILNLTVKKSSVTQELVDAKQVLHNLRKQVDLKDREIKELDDQEAHLKKRLDMISSQKEYMSLTHELDTLNKYRSDGEDLLLVLWNDLALMQK